MAPNSEKIVRLETKVETLENSMKELIKQVGILTDNVNKLTTQTALNKASVLRLWLVGTAGIGGTGLTVTLVKWLL